MTEPHPEIHFDDAFAWLVKQLAETLTARAKPGYHPNHESDLWLPSVIDDYWLRRGITARDVRNRGAEPLYLPFYDAAWELCRRGICGQAK